MGLRRFLPLACVVAHVAVVSPATDLSRRHALPKECNALYTLVDSVYTAGTYARGPSLAIRTPHLRLTEFELGDLTARRQQIENMFGDPEHIKYTSLFTPNVQRLKDFAVEWATAATNERQQGTRTSFTLAVRDDKGNILGITNLAIDRGTGVAEFGFILNKEASGRGNGTEVAHAMAKAAFENLEAKEVRAEVHVDNQPSQRVMEKAGFQRSGRFVTNIDASGAAKRFEIWTLSRRAHDRATGSEPR